MSPSNANGKHLQAKTINIQTLSAFHLCLKSWQQLPLHYVTAVVELSPSTFWNLLQYYAEMSLNYQQSSR